MCLIPIWATSGYPGRVMTDMCRILDGALWHGQSLETRARKGWVSEEAQWASMTRAHGTVRSRVVRMHESREDVSSIRHRCLDSRRPWMRRVVLSMAQVI